MGHVLSTQRLIDAAKHGKCEEIVAACSEDSKLLTCHSLLGDTIWHVAAEKGKVVVLESLVAWLQQEPIKPEQLRAFSKLGSSTSQITSRLINQRDRRRQTALHRACAAGHADCAHLLLNHGADPWACDGSGFRSALHYAATMGHIDCIQALLSHAAPNPGNLHQPNTQETRLVDVRNSTGFTPLHYAVYAGQEDAVSALLSYGADIHASSHYYSYDWVYGPRRTTPLHLAASKGNMNICKALLLAYAESMALEDTLGLNTGHPPPSRRSRPDPRCLRNDDSNTPYHLAIREGHAELATLLHPGVPLSFLFSDEESGTVTRIFGPPRLAVIAAQAMHEKLLQDLQLILKKPEPSTAVTSTQMGTVVSINGDVPSSAERGGGASAGEVAAAGLGESSGGDADGHGDGESAAGEGDVTRGAGSAGLGADTRTVLPGGDVGTVAGNAVERAGVLNTQGPPTKRGRAFCCFKAQSASDRHEAVVSSITQAAAMAVAGGSRNSVMLAVSHATGVPSAPSRRTMVGGASSSDFTALPNGTVLEPIISSPVGSEVRDRDNLPAGRVLDVQSGFAQGEEGGASTSGHPCLQGAYPSKGGMSTGGWSEGGSSSTVFDDAGSTSGEWEEVNGVEEQPMQDGPTRSSLFVATRTASSTVPAAQLLHHRQATSAHGPDTKATSVAGQEVAPASMDAAVVSDTQMERDAGGAAVTAAASGQKGGEPLNAGGDTAGPSELLQAMLSIRLPPAMQRKGSEHEAVGWRGARARMLQRSATDGQTRSTVHVNGEGGVDMASDSPNSGRSSPVETSSSSMSSPVLTEAPLDSCFPLIFDRVSDDVETFRAHYRRLRLSAGVAAMSAPHLQVPLNELMDDDDLSDTSGEGKQQGGGYHRSKSSKLLKRLVGGSDVASIQDASTHSHLDTSLGHQGSSRGHVRFNPSQRGVPSEASRKSLLAMMSSRNLASASGLSLAGGGDDTCEICFDAHAVVKIDDCSHVVCGDCAGELCKLHHFRPALCPFCRGIIRGFHLTKTHP